MELDHLEQQWTALGHDDPLWAILSLPDKRGGEWDLDEFLATGRRDVAGVLNSLDHHGIQVARGRALDFGCGVGRLTQPLAEHFGLCDGVDLAASMIEQAGRLNRCGERCRFQHSTASDLRIFPDRTFDFVISLLVFQHMEPGLMRGYLREVVRVLRPEGVAFFNVPDRVKLGAELPGLARRARIELAGPPIEAEALQVQDIRLRVRNASELPWPLEAQLVVGNHWLGPDEEVLVADDGRTALGAQVLAGEAREVSLTVGAPADPGDYVLEVDVLQEHRGWFADSGSRTLRVPVRVGPSDGAGHIVSGAPAGAPLVPRIEMHVLSRAETTATIEAAGGVVLAAIPRDRCGPEIPSYDYVVKREPSAARARLAERADLTSFRFSSRLGHLAGLSVTGRGLLRRALLEVLARQTEVNRATGALVDELEGQIAQLRAELDTQGRTLADIRQEIHERADRSETAPD